MVFYLHHDILLFYAAQKALKVASSFKRRAQLDLHLFTGKFCKLLKSEQRAFHARRGNFKGVLNGDWIFNIQHTADLTADDGTVVHQYTAFFTDINAQQ
ncbi:hypothetical protein D9M73_136310 [compost metagenome]